MVGLCCIKNPRNMSSSTPATSHLSHHYHEDRSYQALCHNYYQDDGTGCSGGGGIVPVTIRAIYHDDLVLLIHCTHG